MIVITINIISAGYLTVSGSYNYRPEWRTLPGSIPVYLVNLGGKAREMPLHSSLSSGRALRCPLTNLIRWFPRQSKVLSHFNWDWNYVLRRTPLPATRSQHLHVRLIVRSFDPYTRQKLGTKSIALFVSLMTVCHIHLFQLIQATRISRGVGTW